MTKILKIIRYECPFLEPPYDNDRKGCKFTASTDEKIKQHIKEVHQD